MGRLAIIQDKYLCGKVYGESVTAMMEVEEHLNYLRQAYPDIAQAIKTASAANELLR